jgi:hypothetical protein
MASPSQLIQWRDSLQEAVLSGVQTVVDQNGERVTYRSQNELMRALAAAENMIAAVQRSAPSTVRFNTSKGL